MGWQGSLFRSEEMQLLNLFLQNEVAHDCLNRLGELGVCQFRDLNVGSTVFNRKFANEVRHCQEIERQLRLLNLAIDEDGLTAHGPAAPSRAKLSDIAQRVGDWTTEVSESTKNLALLQQRRIELLEQEHVLQGCAYFFASAQGGQRPLSAASTSNALRHSNSSESLGKLGNSVSQHFGDLRTTGGDLEAAAFQMSTLSFSAGVLPREKRPIFERLVFRQTRGNALLHFRDIAQPFNDPHTKEEIYKTFYIVFTPSESARKRASRIAQSCQATTYVYPESREEQEALWVDTKSRLSDLKLVIEQTKTQRVALLTGMAQEVRDWTVKIQHEKGIFHTMNLLSADKSRNVLRGEAWVPSYAAESVALALRQATEASGHNVPSFVTTIDWKKSGLTPPTFFRTNKFTLAFQDIVDAYGTARYQELNPTPFCVITFPFLFGVMFGDWGHGIIMLAFALFMLANENKFAANPNLNEMFLTMFQGRYVIFLMSLFSIYIGLMYNDVFSLTTNFFGSAYTCPEEPGAFCVFHEEEVVKFGVDPAWKHSSNELLFYNSLKMKLSILLGVTHMATGVFCSMFNAIDEKSMLNFLCEFIPQILFMLSIFGYLCFLIVWKWVFRFDVSLITLLINMFMNPTAELEEEMFANQLLVHWILVGLAFICVPWMLLAKPLILKRRMKKQAAESHAPLLESDRTELNAGNINSDAVASEEADPAAAADAEGGHAEHDFGEIFVHQIIHTIEYVLGCVSNTASYLRLWALSLAHAQLSHVFWNMIMNLDSYGGVVGGIKLMVAFSIWAMVTLGVLMIMESLSAFLHALRLHWVEFMNKFYHGDGHKFNPFSYAAIEKAARNA